MTQDERRHFTRVTFDAPAFIKLPSTTIDAIVVDLSFKGALVRTTSPGDVQVGMSVQLNIILEMIGAIIMSGDVVHVHDTQVGLVCRSIDLDSMIHLRRLIELHLHEQHLLDREFRALVSG
jgi:hypothetical protein